MLTASTFIENKISIDLHEKLGFKIAGTRKKIAQREGKWTDTALMDRRGKLACEQATSWQYAEATCRRIKFFQ